MANIEERIILFTTFRLKPFGKAGTAFSGEVLGSIRSAVNIPKLHGAKL